MYISKEEARVHNLINRFSKNKNLRGVEQLSKIDLTDKLFFREEDFQIAIDGNILKKESDGFFTTDFLKAEVNRVLNNIIKNEQELARLEEEYLLKFKELNESDSYRPTEELINMGIHLTDVHTRCSI